MRVNHQPRNILAKNIIATPVVKRLLIPIILSLTNAFILGRYLISARVVMNGFKRSVTLIAISRHTTQASSSALSLVVHVEKHFTALHPTTLMFVL